MSEIDLIIKRLKESIESSGLTYVQLANKTGISKSALQRYANGATKKIPVDSIIDVASAVNVSPAWIMGWSDDQKEFKNSVISDYKEKRLLEYFEMLNELGKDKAIENLSDLVEIIKYTEETERKKKNA